MHVLLTGAAGYIGGAILDALLAAGHAPLAVAHSADVAAAIRARGGTPVAGDLRDPAGLAALAARADAVIHAANTNAPDAGAVDTAATRALLRALRGTDRPLVYTSGVWVLGASERVLDERSPRHPTPLIAWRAALEEEIAESGARGVVVRPGIAFGEGGGIPGLLARGELPLVGDGRQRWPLVHVRDLAALYLRALDAPAGAVLHGVAAAATMREVALLGRAAHGGGAPAALSLARAREQFGDFADALALDQVVSSSRTRALVGWAPGRTSVVEEVLGLARGVAA